MEKIVEVKGGIELHKTSPLSGSMNSMFLAIDKIEFMERNVNRKFNNILIQDVFPEFLPEQREFISTGITPDEWAKIF